MDESEWVDVTALPLVADEAWMTAFEAARNGDHTKEADSWVPRNLADLDDKPPIEPMLGGLGFVYPGKRHVFSGPQESAKTLAAYVVALEVIRAGQKVVLIDFEMGPWDCKARLRELGATHDELGGFLYVEPEASASAANVGRLVGLEPALVVVDAAAGAFQLESYDDNSRKDVERWASAWVNPFWKAGIATIVLDHVTKNVEARGSYAIGSERKVGGADVHLGFEVVHAIKRGGHGLYKIVTHKDRGGYLKRGKLCEFELRSDPDTNFIEWTFKASLETDEKHPFRPTHLMEKVSRYVEAQMDPVPRSAVERDVEGKRDYIRQALDLLVSEGYLEESEGARGARLTESITGYREAFDTIHSDLAPTSPHLAPNRQESTSPLAPTPYRGGEAGDLAPTGDLTSPQGVPDDDDGIPF